MGNIKNFNFNKLDLKVSNSDYWDFFLNNDDSLSYENTLIDSNCSVVWYDFDSKSIFNGNLTIDTIYSLVTWTGATNTGYTLNTIGLTGIDNGLITFNTISGDTNNDVLVSTITGSTLIIPSGDTRLILNRVSGVTNNFVYPINLVTSGSVGDYVNLCGGFYQGYYKIDGTSYEVLPNRVNSAWSTEFWLNPSTSGCSNTNSVINDSYPNNKGFFFYMGTRAENKYWNQFGGGNTDCTKDCTQPSGCTDSVSTWCTPIKEIDVAIVGDYGIGIPLNPPQIEIDLITNPFLIYGRAIDYSSDKNTGTTGSFIYNYGIDTNKHSSLSTKNTLNYDGNGIVVTKLGEHKTNNQNPFLIYGRANKNPCNCSTCCGSNDNLGNETVCSFSGFTELDTEIDPILDITDNALGFRITDDGAIGYRSIIFTGDCSGSTDYSIKEEYSASGVVSSDTWSYIAIKFVATYMNDCDLKTSKKRKGKLMFYVKL